MKTTKRGTMSGKPSYLGLLNAVALAEAEAHTYLRAWIEVTPDDGVRGILRTIAAREGEHAASFARRIDELGYEVRPRAGAGEGRERALAVVRSDRSDLEKLEALNLHRLDTGDAPDIFDDFFKDHSIDIVTGELLGRYIAEERDTARLFRRCYEQLQASSQPVPARATDDRLAGLERKLDALCETVGGLFETVAGMCETVSGLCEAMGTASVTNGARPAKTKSK